MFFLGIPYPMSSFTKASSAPRAARGPPAPRHRPAAAQRSGALAEQGGCEVGSLTGYAKWANGLHGCIVPLLLLMGWNPSSPCPLSLSHD